MAELFDPNRDALIKVANALRGLRGEVVFVGGAAVGLLVTDPAAPPIRVTKDVDCIIEVASRGDYFGRVRDQLIERGFRELQGDEIPVCAWEYEGIRLDVMPTEETILGFSNQWYAHAIQNAEDVELSDVRIRLIRPQYFIATKMAAFRSRGAGDYFASHDIEDLVAVVDGRPSICEEVEKAEKGIREHVSELAAELIINEAFLNALQGHVIDPGRERVVLDRLSVMAGSQ